MIKSITLASILSLYNGSNLIEVDKHIEKLSSFQLNTQESNGQQNKCDPWDSCRAIPQKEEVDLEKIEAFEFEGQQNKCDPWDSCVVRAKKDSSDN